MHDDLVALFVCSKCGGKNLGLIYAAGDHAVMTTWLPSPFPPPKI